MSDEKKKKNGSEKSEKSDRRPRKGPPIRSVVEHPMGFLKDETGKGHPAKLVGTNVPGPDCVRLQMLLGKIEKRNRTAFVDIAMFVEVFEKGETGKGPMKLNFMGAKRGVREEGEVKMTFFGPRRDGQKIGDDIRIVLTESKVDQIIAAAPALAEARDKMVEHGLAKLFEPESKPEEAEAKSEEAEGEDDDESEEDEESDEPETAVAQA